MITMTFFTIRWVEQIWKKEFALIALHPKDETFVVYITFFACFNLGLEIYSFHRAQIAFLKADKVFTSIFSKFFDCADVFSKDLVAKLWEYTRIDNYTINLVEDQQPPYNLIYNLRLIELKTLKTYIKTNLANGFKKPSKSLTNIFIIFIEKSDNSS